jgi:hypothetical protein
VGWDRRGGAEASLINVIDRQAAMLLLDYP